MLSAAAQVNPPQWQDVIGGERREGNRWRRQRIDPDELGDFARCGDGRSGLNEEAIGTNGCARFVSRVGLEAAKRREIGRDEDEAELFLELADESRSGGLSRLELAAGLHEGRGIRFAAEQRPAVGADDECSSDVDDAGHWATRH